MTKQENAVLDLNAADNSLILSVKAMHVHYGIAYNKLPRIDIGKDLRQFRHKLLKEEVQEYKDAKTIEDIYDALLDIIVVAVGTLEQHGLPLQSGFDEVMKANMAKVVGATSRGYSKDLQKPDDWTPPNLTKILKQYLEDIKLCQL